MPEPTTPAQVYTIGTAYQDQMRAMAWGHIGAVVPVAVPSQQDMQDWELALAERARQPVDPEPNSLARWGRD